MDVRQRAVQSTSTTLLVLPPQYTPQPLLLFTRSKEGGFYPTQMRSDYASVEETGNILQPTLSELAAQVLTRFLEVHEKDAPYTY